MKGTQLSRNHMINNKFLLFSGRSEANGMRKRRIKSIITGMSKHDCYLSIV